MKPQRATFKKILTDSNGYFRVLTAQIDGQLKVLQTIRQALPDELAPHAIHCVSQGKKLTVYTDASVWATPLRFHKQTILTSTALLKEAYTELLVKVISPIDGDIYLSKSDPIIPPQSVINAIQDFGLRIDDQQLQESLLRLSKTLSRLQKKPKN